MRQNRRKNLFLITLLQLTLYGHCFAQTDTADPDDERILGRYLLDVSYSKSDALEGDIDLVSPGFTWLLSSDVRVGLTTSFARFNPDDNMAGDPEDLQTTHGLGDSIIFIQYDWDQRLTASPWVPDNLGMNVSLLAPTGNTSDSLSLDAWAAGVSLSWPIIKGHWLLNPLIGYNTTFSEGKSAEHVNAVEVGLGLVRLFPSKFWIGITPFYWYDIDTENGDFDYHFTVGKMFSNGIGIGFDYGNVARNSKKYIQPTNNLLLNFYYQFGH